MNRGACQLCPFAGGALIVLQEPEPLPRLQGWQWDASDGGSKSYTSIEDAMKGVAKQVNGLRDDNGNRTARFMKCRMPSRLPANSCRWKTVLWTSLHWLKVVRAHERRKTLTTTREDQNGNPLAFASTAAKAATAFELPADELSEVWKIAQLYKIPTRNIEQLGDALNYLDDNAMSKGQTLLMSCNVWAVWRTVWIIVKKRRWVSTSDTGRCAGGCSQCANAMVRELSMPPCRARVSLKG